MQLAHEDRGDAATAEAESALELYRQAGDHAGIAEALCELAIAAAVYADDVAQDRRYAEQACRHARLAGDDRMLGRALARLAAVSGNRRREVLEQAAEYLARVGDYRELAMAYSNTAYVALAENSVPEAVSLLEVALKAVERVDSAYLEMIVLGNLGLAQLFSGDIDRAEQTFGRQLRLCREHGYRNNSEGVVGMAAVAAGHCHYETAARLRGAARAAGYPPAMFDQHIEARLERDYFVPARERYGLGVWRRAEAEGAALAYEQAVDCALNQPTGPRRDAQRRRRKHAPKLNGGSRT
jgi:tetratricopeptide (TPR) repeat protein